MTTDSVKVGLNKNGNKRGMHPNSIKNLTRKGCGRPKNELSITNLARKKLQEPCPFAADKTWLEYLVERWLGQAVENATYFNQLMDRLEGKVVQPVEAEVREIKDVRELSDEELAVIAAKNILKNNVSRGGNGASEEAGS